MLRKGTACVASMTIPDWPVFDPEIRPHRALPVFFILDWLLFHVFLHVDWVLGGMNKMVQA